MEVAPTDKQVTFLRKLLAEREGIPAAEGIRQALNVAREAGALDRRTVSQAIDGLLRLKTQRPDPHRHAELHAQPTVPAGHYATASRTGANDLDFWVVDVPTDGKWAGHTFVSRVIGGHEDQRVRGAEQRQALEAIHHAGPAAAGALYGQELGRCYRCNRTLTDDTSRKLGIGPECRKHL